jgi:hypothetical protein
MGTIFLDYSRGINDGFQPPGRLPKKELENTSMYTEKKKIKFSSCIRKFRMEQLQSHKRQTASSYMFKYLRISSYEEAIPHTYRYDFATASF